MVPLTTNTPSHFYFLKILSFSLEKKIVYLFILFIYLFIFLSQIISNFYPLLALKKHAGVYISFRIFSSSISYISFHVANDQGNTDRRAQSEIK